MQHVTRSLLILVGILVSPAVAAQVCDDEMTYNDCSDALNAELTGFVDQFAAETRKTAIADLNTINTGSQTGSDTATDDFNPRIQVSVDALGLNGDNTGALTLSSNDFLQNFLKNQIFGDDGESKTSGQHHKLIVKLEAAKLFDPLEQAISDESISSDLENSLNDFDDVSLDLRFSLNSKKYGRDINSHIGLLDSIQRVSMEEASPQRALMFAIGDEEDKMIQEIDAWDADVPLNQLISKNDANALINRMQAARTSHLEYGAAYQAAAKKNGLFNLMALVNNQPQLVFAAKAQIRDELVGPDEYSARLAYEFGGVNVNTYNRYRINRCGADGSGLADNKEVECLTKFVGLNTSAISDGNRFALSLEYLQRNRYRIDVQGVMLDLDQESSLIATLNYGRYVDIGLSSTGLQSRSRFDLSASYEDVSSDPARQNRALASATFAQEIGNGLLLTVSLVWANNPEFRGDVDEEFSAMAGISYKLAQQQ